MRTIGHLKNSELFFAHYLFIDASKANTTLCFRAIIASDLLVTFIRNMIMARDKKFALLYVRPGSKVGSGATHVGPELRGDSSRGRVQLYSRAPVIWSTRPQRGAGRLNVAGPRSKLSAAGPRHLASRAKKLTSDSYGTAVIQTTLDMTEAEKQLRHANEQLVLAGAYPGRGRARPRGKVIEM